MERDPVPDSDPDPVTLVDRLSVQEGADIEFEPERWGFVARTPEL